MKRLSAQDQNNQALTNVPNPINNGDGANKQYVDSKRTEYTVGATDGDFPVSSYSTFSHAVNAALAVGNVFIKPGTYTVPASGSITITPVNNRRVRGAGIGSTIIQTLRTDYVFKNTNTLNDFVVEDLTIDCQNASIVNAARFLKSTRVGMRRCEFKRSAQWFVVFGNEPSASTTDMNYDCFMEDCVFDTHSSIYEMLLVYNSINTKISRCIFKAGEANSPTLGLWQLTNQTIVDKCEFYNCQNKPIYYSNTSDNLTIRDCYFENCGSSIIGGNASDNGLLGRTYAYNLRVLDNTFIGGTNSQTAFAVQVGAVDGFWVTGNYIEGYESGLKVGNGNTTGSTTVPYPSKNGEIARNTAKNLNPLATSYGIHNFIVFADSGGANTSIYKNIILDTQSTKTLKHAISFNTSSATYDYIRINENDFSGVGVVSSSSIILNNSVTLGANSQVFNNYNFTSTGSNPKQNANITSTGIDSSSNKIVNVATPTANTDAATKAYVDSTVSSGAPDATTTSKGKVQLAGDLGGTADSPKVKNKQKVYNIADYGAVGDGYDTGIANQHYNTAATDNTAAIAAAIAAITSSATGTGILYTPDGCFMTDKQTIPQGVTLKGNGRGTSGWILKSGSTTPTLLISSNFATAAGQQYGSYGGTSYFNIDDMFFDGNAGNITATSGASDYRDQNAIIKLYSWHFGMRNLDVRNAKENGLYTEYVDAWSDSFNAYQFAESYVENTYVKTYGGAGWCNRGPHDMNIKNVYISSYYNANGNYTGVTPYVGYVQQSSGATGKYYSSAGVNAYNLHVWGQHLTNSIYLDSSNIIDGWVYAEGSTQANIKLVNSSGNRFKAEIGFSGATTTGGAVPAAPGVELFGSSNYNHIEAKIESNITGGLFQLDTVASYNYLAHVGGYNTSVGAVFDLTTGGTYTGLRNTFIPNDSYTGNKFLGTPNQLDNIGNAKNSVIYADDYGATGDDVTDDAARINAAVAAAPEGGVIQLSARKYRINSPVFLTRNKTLRGTQGLRWRYVITPNTYLKPRSTFSGLAAIIMQDKEQGSYATEQGGQRVQDLNIDLSALTSGTTDGVRASGLVRDVRIENVSVSYARGKGFNTLGYTRADASTNYPRGWQLSHCIADTGFDNGFSFNLLTDSSLDDCLAVGNAYDGFWISGSGENLFTACRAVFNKNNGFKITNSQYGTTSFSNCSTDRNEYNGMLINVTGTNTGKYPINLTGVNFRRDGRNGNTGGGAYAGLAVTSATSPVIVDNISVVQGVDDNGTGTSSPVYGISASGSDVSVTSGHIWGNTTAVNNGGSNTNLIVNQAVQLATGPVGGTKTTVQSGGTATTGYVLTANGTGTSPTWQLPAIDGGSA